jgi:hypothetical protein
VFLLRRLLDLITAFDDALLALDDEEHVIETQIPVSITRA